MWKPIALSLLVISLWAPAAVAQQSIATYVDVDVFNPSNPLYAGDVSIPAGSQFEIVVLLDNTGADMSGFEFYVTPLVPLSPGVFLLGTVVFNDGVTLSTTPGEFVIESEICSTEPVVALVRIHYGAFGGAPGPDMVVELISTVPENETNRPGITHCDGSVEYPVFATRGCYTGSGVTYPDGGLVINGTPIGCPTESGTFGAIKACFR